MQGETIVIADGHLAGQNRQLDEFLDFLSMLEQNRIAQLFILGDLFNIWVGSPRMLLAHQTPVLNAFQRLAHRGITLKYVEGNRDYFLAPLYLNDPFHEIASDGLLEQIGNHAIYLAHGDLVNTHDRQYRLWRSISRNRALFGLFGLLPGTLAVRLAHVLERKFRTTNRKHKSYFPFDACQTYVRNIRQQGAESLILGHFHEKRYHEFLDENGRPFPLYVLPAWYDSLTYLHINRQGDCSFEQFSPPRRVTASQRGNH